MIDNSYIEFKKSKKIKNFLFINAVIYDFRLSVAQKREIMLMIEWHDQTFCMVDRSLAWVSRPVVSDILYLKSVWNENFWWRIYATAK